MINEDKLIKALQKSSHGFIGDDAAVLPSFNANTNYVIAKDVLAEDRHFRIKHFTAEHLAHKALHVNLSDLAAMGARPLYLLCGLSIPDNLQHYACEFLNALTDICQKNGVILIGGDTTASKSHFFISITVIGQATETNIKYRSTAQMDDVICLAGNLGFAHLGFQCLEQSKATDSLYINSFLCPEAKIKEGLWFGKQASITSMMDVSDGLYIDLKRLCEASNKGAEINIDYLLKYSTTEISLQSILEGGEDYGLLVTVNKDSFKALSHEFSKTFGYNLKRIGHIREEQGLEFKQAKQRVEIPLKPFSHFGENL